MKSVLSYNIALPSMVFFRVSTNTLISLKRDKSEGSDQFDFFRGADDFYQQNPLTDQFNNPILRENPFDSTGTNTGFRYKR